MDLLPKDVQQSRRVVQTVAQTDSGPVLFIGIYGFHQGLPEGMARTDELLRMVASRADRLGLPTVIAGDLNYAPDALDVWTDLRQAGWSDAAELQAHADGQSMQMTFREISRIDVVLFNDRARPAFRAFWTSQCPEGDHRRVFARFRWGDVPRHKTHWRQPTDLRRVGIPAQDFQKITLPPSRLQRQASLVEQGDVQKMWDVFCEDFEYAAAEP